MERIVWEVGCVIGVWLLFTAASRSWIVGTIAVGLAVWDWWEREHRGPHDLD